MQLVIKPKLLISLSLQSECNINLDLFNILRMERTEKNLGLLPLISISTASTKMQQYELLLHTYRVADRSLARPRRKQATATEDSDVHISYL